MAIRIYDQTVGQLAGVVVTTTGKGTIKNDGTEAYAQLVVPVDESGDPAAVGLLNASDVRINPATNETTQEIVDALNEPVDYLPAQPVPLVADAAYSVLTNANIAFATLTTAQALLTVGASEYGRIHEFAFTVSGNASAAIVTFKSGSTTLRSYKVPVDIPLVIAQEFNSYTWLKSGAVGEDLTVESDVSCDFRGGHQYKLATT